MEGALLAIRFARESRRPFLGTCGGLQHAVIEYARNVLGWADAEHAETAPDAARPVISLLECALVEATESILLRRTPASAPPTGARKSSRVTAAATALNPALAVELTAGSLQSPPAPQSGEVRALELAAHPFFVATLFQPERAALRGEVPPLAQALIDSSVRYTLGKTSEA